MRVLLSIVLIAAAYARPDVGSGYNYNAGGNFPGISDNSGGYSDGGYSDGGYSDGGYEDPLINKQFYLHTAPEDRDVQHKHLRLGRPQKNYRVVFIKAPAAGRTRLSAEFAPQEEKTAIYVLSQKEHEIDIGDIATPAPTQPSKPEVFFVKYKTQQEAEHAQRQIQAQYDSLGGSSKFSDEGIAPISSVIGSFGGHSGSGFNNRPSSSFGSGFNNRPSSSFGSGFNNRPSSSGGLNQNYLPPRAPTSNYLPPIRRL